MAIDCAKQDAAEDIVGNCQCTDALCDFGDLRAPHCNRAFEFVPERIAFGPRISFDPG
ncbi:hypothetical protein [Bosea sp. (in: a-proteobacteria)]|uniref:hypothetical protein n=1 Tax=Bosea sp. (in: a-proteobacteria) TaxID=1871050 RepID=UPI002DDD96B4|nr:hypothetical protein [Bosea sp. (in: a-proteobacteria)]